MTENNYHFLREDQIISALFDEWGNVRRFMHNRRMYAFMTKFQQIYLQGIRQVITQERLDPWLLEIALVVEQEIARGMTTHSEECYPEEHSVLASLMELWYDLKWEAFDASSKLILLDGLEKVIETRRLNQRLLRIVDMEKELATDIMKGELAIEAYRDRKKKNQDFL